MKKITNPLNFFRVETDSTKGDLSYSPILTEIKTLRHREVFALSSMETFIVAIGLVASGIGTLILLLSLAHKRSQLVKAFNVQQEIEERQRRLQENRARMNSQRSEPAIGAASPGPG